MKNPASVWKHAGSSLVQRGYKCFYLRVVCVRPRFPDRSITVLFINLHERGPQTRYFCSIAVQRFKRRVRQTLRPRQHRNFARKHVIERRPLRSWVSALHSALHGPGALRGSMMCSRVNRTGTHIAAYCSARRTIRFSGFFFIALTASTAA